MQPVGANQPYAYYPNPSPPKKKLALTGGLALLIILLAIGLSSCGALVIVNPDFGMYYETATQEYNGTMNIHLLTVVLKNESFEPTDIMANETGKPYLNFHPFCGVSGTAEANRSILIVASALNRITINGNVTQVRLDTHTYTKGTHSQKELQDQLKCIMTKVKTVFEAKLGLKLKNEHMSYQVSGPGFEGAAAVVSLVVVSYIIRKKREAQKSETKTKIRVPSHRRKRTPLKGK